MTHLLGGHAAGLRKAARLHALRVRLAGPATPLEADPVAQVPLDLMARHRPAIDTSLSVPFVAGPDGGAVPPVAKPIAALAIVRAIAIRHILRPSSGLRHLREPHDEPWRWPAIVGDRLIEWSERSFWRQESRILRSRRRSHWHRWWLWRMREPHSRRCIIARRTGDHTREAPPCHKRKERASRTYPAHLRPHGQTHPGFLPPGPPRKNMPLFKADRV